MQAEYLLIPIVTALIGWGTNVIAVKMLFHPRKAINLGFIKIQGVVPKRHDALAKSISEIFEKELLSTEDLVARFNKIDFTDEASELLQNKMHLIIEDFVKQMPMASMFLNDTIKQQIFDHAQKHFVQMIPDFKQLISNKVLQDYNLKEFLEEKIKDFSIDQLESIIMHVATKELKTIEWLGGLLGLLIGLLQLGVMIAL
ncbi:MAG: DUF445 family protein [Chlamydiales bacterium]|nr:DUF445 family protein [Chlamydiales bacterium]NCF70977.1 DUF445 family protein [Chlamydiales bacterium]